MAYWTLSNLRASLCDNLRISSTEVGVYGTSTVRDGFLNNGQKDFIRRTKALTTKIALNLVDGQQEYDISEDSSAVPTNVLQIDAEGGVIVNDRRLDPTSIQRLDLISNGWREQDASIPSEYYIRSLKTLGLVPAPASKTITETVTRGSSTTDTLSHTNTVLFSTTAVVTNSSGTVLTYTTNYTEASGVITWVAGAPTAGTTYTVTYSYMDETYIHALVRPNNMIDVSDVPFNAEPMLEEYTEAPLLYATWKLLIRGREVEEATLYKKEYFEMIRQCIYDLNNKEDRKDQIIPLIYNGRR